MIKKDPTILRLLALLDLTKEGWRTVGHWDADLVAVGIASVGNSGRIVYISTFNEPPGRYYYECEVSNGSEPTDFDVTDRVHGATFDELLCALRRHLPR